MREQHATRLRTEAYLARLQEEERRGPKEVFRRLDLDQQLLDQILAAQEKALSRDGSPPAAPPT